ncbi:MAG: succinate--CoA ligase subunit alpha [Thermotogota bacterium]
MINGNERICVQGITGTYGKAHTIKMLNYGSQIVCGVSNNKNIKSIHGVPVFNNVKEAVKKYYADTSIVFVPPKSVKDAVIESIESKIKKIIIITEHVPTHDMLILKEKAIEKKVNIIGPNCPGIIIPGKSKIGIMPENAFKKGDIAIISKSGTLMYEIANYVSKKSSGIRIGIGLGGDPIIGTNIAEAMDFIIKKNIKKVIIIGELGGKDELNGIENAKRNGFKGKIKVFLAGRTAPKGRTMGHAGAIVNGYEGTIKYKEEKLKNIGINVAKKLEELIF